MVFAEALTEYLIDGLSEALAKADDPTPPIMLAADRYVALSTLQKAIRRGEEALALRAAATLRIEGPHALWRRLGIIAFEDIGVANIDAVGWTTVVILISFFSGVIMLSLGIIGEYMSRIIREVRGSPTYLIREQRVGGQTGPTPSTQSAEIQENHF